MTLKEKQEIYSRFQSKMESACCVYVNERVKQHGTIVSDTFIIDDVVPKVWEHLEESIDALIKSHKML